MSRSTSPAASLPLSRVPPGEPRVVERIEGSAREELEREGLVPGAPVTVATRSPLGGPLVVRVGSARLALAATVAVQVVTAPASDTGTGTAR